MTDHVHIVLGTYNGTGYLSRMLDSLRAQTYRDFSLLVRDDESSDDTRGLLAAAARHDSRIEVVADDRGNLGCVANFSTLAELAVQRGATHVMFADQDDVWFPDKIERSLDAFHQAETRHGRDAPILVHSDLEVIDGAGVRRHRSFMRFQRIHHEASAPFRTLLVQNFVTGCTVTANRALLAIALPFPDSAMMHDWWLALCAAGCGQLEFLSAPTMAYRRHDENVVTARGFWRTMNPLRTNWGVVFGIGTRHHARTVPQAEVLVERLTMHGSGQSSAARLAKSYIALHAHRTAMGRVTRALSMGLRSQTLPRTMALYARLLSWRQMEGRATEK